MNGRASTSKSAWSVSPETIMSHHFRLAKGVPSVIDIRPPHSMYNSPISIHYHPKTRPSSADPNKRRTLTRPQRELNDFVNGRQRNKNPLPMLTKRSSLTDLTKPKLLENPNYQPPRKRVQQQNTTVKQPINDMKNTIRFQKINDFKDTVLSEVISQDDYSDRFILDTIRRNMENLAGIVPWNDLEHAASELMANLDISDTKKLHHKKIETPKMDLSSISGSSKSSSSASSSYSSTSSSSGSV